MPPSSDLRHAHGARLAAAVAGILVLASAGLACGAGGVPRGHFLRVRSQAPVCEARTDEDGDGQVDSIVFDHYDRRERVAVQELDEDADGQIDVRTRYAYGGGLLRRVEVTADAAAHTRLLEYVGEELVRETWRDADDRRHVRVYGREGRPAPDALPGEHHETVTRTHDADDRVLTEDRTLPNGGRTFTTFGYDERGDRVSERLEQAGQPMACVVEFEHDDAHRLRRQVHRLGDTPEVETVFTWRPDGTLASRETRSSGVLRQRTDYGEGCRVREVSPRH